MAWSNFINGMDPGGHNIFDFFNRDPKTYVPVFSATETTSAAKTIRLGKTVIPLSGGGLRNLRKGRAFWQVLEEAGIPSTIFKMPSNYPPVESKQRTPAGMNTPDLKVLRHLQLLHQRSDLRHPGGRRRRPGHQCLRGRGSDD